MMAHNNYKRTIYACYGGYITQAIVNNYAPLLFLTFQREFNIPLEQITLLVTINFLIQLLIDLISAKFVDIIGIRKCVIASHFFAAAGLAGLGIFPFIMPPFLGLLLAVTLYAIGGGLLEVLVSPIVESCPTDNKASVMSLLHSFYCWGTVFVVAFSTGFLFVFGKESWRILAVLWAVFPVANSVLFSKAPINPLTKEGEGMSIKSLCCLKLFWVFFVLMFAAGACEQAMSQWASAFAESGLGVSKTIGDLLGPCFFSILMGSSRALYAKFGAKLNLLKCIIICGIICAASYLIASLSPVSAVALIGCGLCGFSVGILWPGVFSTASAALPKGGTALFALLALAGDLGCSGGPTVVGFAAGLFDNSLRNGLLCGVIFPIVLISASLVCMKLTKKSEK